MGKVIKVLVIELDKIILDFKTREESIAKN
jgi:hypothetical protein